MGLTMRVSAQLELENKTNDTNAIIYNAKSEFYEFYTSINLSGTFTVEEVNASVLQQIENSDKGIFYAVKANAPFKVTIDCEKKKVIVEPILSKNMQDLTFYLYRTLEICNNFAIYELEATKAHEDQYK